LAGGPRKGKIGRADREAAVKALVEGLCFPEGPVWVGNRLLYVEVYADRVGAWDGRAKRTLWERKGTGPCAVEQGADGELLVACYASNAIARLSADGRLLGTIGRDDEGRPMVGCNDLVRDSRGGVYFTASGVWDGAAPPQGKVFYLAPGAAPRLVADKLHFTNGLALTDGGLTLIVAETLAQRVTAFAVSADGSLARARPFCRMAELAPLPEGADPFTGPDGIELHPGGEIYICEYGAGRVQVVDGAGRLRRTIATPTPFVTNVAFSPDGARAYVAVVHEPTKHPYDGALYELAVA
jgi:gluconolactonase